MNRKIIDNLKNLAKKYDLDFLILFGSRAKKTNKNTSDWDIAYYKLRDNINFKDIYNDILEIISFQDLNLINLSDDNSFLLEEEIFRTGKKIYIKNQDIYFQRRNITFFNYNDYRNFDNIIKKNLEI